MANPLPIKAGHLFIGLAVIMGLGTLMLFTSIGKKPKEKVKVERVQIETQQIVVPLGTIFQGEVIDVTDVKEVAWPKDFLPSGQSFSDSAMVVGRVAKQDLLPGEPIFIEKVSGPEGRAGLPAIIPPGMRAVTVAVSEVKAVAGFVKPGDRVDVLVTFLTREVGNGERPERVTKTVLQNALVLAAAQTMTEDTGTGSIEAPPGVVRGEASTSVVNDDAEDEDDGDSKKSRRSKKEEKSDAKKKADEKKVQKEAEKERARMEKQRRESEKKAKNISSVTLAVSPEDAQVITIAEETGELRLVLRADADNEKVNVGATVSADILSGGGKTAPVLPPTLDLQEPSAPVVFGPSVEVIQGTTKSTVSF